ncbi:MAG: TlpA disulfide reductase family protein [Burkholderiaceae bacterium]
MSVQRRTLVGPGGRLAGAAGAGLAWWRHSPPRRCYRRRSRVSGPRNRNLQGQPLSLAAFRGRPLLVNFWATWCPPCVEELPLLNAFYEAHAARGWRRGPCGRSGQAVQISSCNACRCAFQWVAGFGGVELSRTLGNPNGGCPSRSFLMQRGSAPEDRQGTPGRSGCLGRHEGLKRRWPHAAWPGPKSQSEGKCADIQSSVEWICSAMGGGRRTLIDLLLRVHCGTLSV